MCDKSSGKQKKFVYLVLILSIILVLFTGVQNYSAAVASDEHSYIRTGQDISDLKLFHENHVIDILYKDVSENRNIYVYYGSFIMNNGKIYLGAPIGFPLILVVFIKIVGLNSVFFVNIIFLGVLMLFFFFLVRELFYKEHYSWYIAIFSVLLIIQNNIWELFRSSLFIWRDISAFAFLILSLFFLLRAQRGGESNNKYLILFSFFLGISCMIRLTNALIIPIIGLYLLLGQKEKISYKKILIITLFFIIGISPLLIQNYLISGNAFLPAQAQSISGLEIGHEQQLLPMNLLYVAQTYGPVLLFLLLVGLIFSWKKTEVKFLFILPPIIFILFFSLWSPESKSLPRYLLVIHPFLIIIISYGIVKILSFIEENRYILQGINKIGKYKKSFPLLIGILVILGDLVFNLVSAEGFRIGYLDQMAILFGITLIAYNHLPENKILTFSMIMLFIPVLLFPAHFPVVQPPGFQFAEASELKNNVENSTDNGSVILACKHLCEVIDLHTTRCSEQPWRMEQLIGYEKGVNRLLDSNIPVYIIDNNDKRNCSKYIELTEKHFKLVPVGKIDASKLKLLKQCGKEYCTIYKIEYGNETRR